MPASVFDIIGPAMVGPSSSHTAGAARIGLLARGLLGSAPARARVGLHGSFAATGSGHATDRAIAAGLLGWAPDDARLKDALEAAPGLGLELVFERVDLGESVHPNTASVEAAGPFSIHLVASSVGGGAIETVCVDGYPLRFSGRLSTLVLWHADRPGFLAQVTAVLACVEANIATIQTARRQRADQALTGIELDTRLPGEAAAVIRRIAGVGRLAEIDPLP